jgi:hypothetical protein
MKLALALLLLTTVTADAKTACRSAPDPSIPPPWAWRMIDSRVCWYPGERKRDKSLLYWPHEARAESAAPAAVSASPATAVEPPTTAPEPEPEPEPLQSYSPEDEKLLESYWPDLQTLLAERSPTHQEMFIPPASNWRDHDVIMILVLALLVVSGLVLGLEMLKTRFESRRTA